MGPLAAKWFDHTGCDVWFLSRVTEVSREADVWNLTVSTIGGSFFITSDHLLDTTPDFDLHWFFGESAPKGTLSLTVAAENGFDFLPVPEGHSMAEAGPLCGSVIPRKYLLSRLRCPLPLRKDSARFGILPTRQEVWRMPWNWDCI